jgi:hypothetical protein
MPALLSVMRDASSRLRLNLLGVDVEINRQGAKRLGKSIEELAGD